MAMDPLLQRREFGSCLLIGRLTCVFSSTRAFFYSLKKLKVPLLQLCFFCRSATGKSTLLKQLVAHLAKKTTLYLVNVRGEEVAYYEKKHGKTEKISIAQINKVKQNSLVIVEDIINTSKEEESNLRSAINYTVHHKKVKLFCVTHTITKTGIYSMLSLFNYVIFTGSPSNVPVMRSCLRFFKIDNEMVDQWLGCVKRESRERKLAKKQLWDPYFFFDCTKMTFCMASDLITLSGVRTIGSVLNESDSCTESDEDDGVDGNFFLKLEPNQQHRQKRRRRESRRPKSSEAIFNGSLASCMQSKTNPVLSEAEKRRNKERIVKGLKLTLASFFQGHKFYSQALAVFAVILKKLNPETIDPADLSVSFKRKLQHQKEKKISMIDYIACLLEEDKKPAIDQIVLHNYVSKLCVLPLTCIRNKYLKTKQ